ncbi:MAG: acyl-CoA dehydrogenase family protein [Deltaproteobacteria bacterium]|nr:acyl-CoA dehydrogenase family protein [Deltaproteobacteria bacterium]MBW2053623.1 acyl-CoA dehydrogenase family protein [Deltaproteobacteria bacterium]MBW2323946.1 acyl-CoA dehydrogenase family protein [Deltaproteobacteria bacterium]
MIDFSLTEEQKKTLELAREFTATEIRPVALEYDRDGTYPEEILKKAKELGLMYTNIPVEYGGSGMDHVTHYIVTEALNYECCAIGQMIGISHLGTGAILLGGTEEQKKRLLGRMTESYRSACFCLTEPGAGSDAGAIQTTAVRKGDRYVINGSKCYITNGKYADLLCLFATIDKSKGTRGICCFAIPRDTPGIQVGRVEDKMGHRALNVSELFFEDVEVGEENLIGEEGQGFKLAMMALDRGRVNVTSVCTGVAQKALDEALRWAKEREQFGEPIGNFQGIHFMLADMNALIMASRAMYLQVAWMLDQGIRCSTEAAAAKCFASDAAMKVTTDAVQIQAGSGYMKGSVVEKLMRDVKLTQIFEGTNQINRIVSGRGLLRERSILF